MRAASSVATAASNTDVVITLSAISHLRHELNYIVWSYSGGTPAGRLAITIGGVSVMDFDITTAGPGAMRLPDLGGDKNAAMVITLYAGGISVTGKLNIYAGSRT